MEENKVLDYEGLRTLIAFINIFFSKKDEIQKVVNKFYTKDQIDLLISNFTTSDDVETSISNAISALTIPSSTSDLNNDSNFISSDISSLISALYTFSTIPQQSTDDAPTTDTEFTNKKYVDDSILSAISGITTISFSVVQELPQEGSSNIIYLVPNSGSGTNVYDEYIYISNSWEKLGTTEVDLTNYYDKTATDTLLSGKVDVVGGKGLSTEDYTSTEKTKLSGIETGAEVNDIDTIKVNGTEQTVSNKAVDITVPTSTSQLNNNSGFITQTDVDNSIKDRIIYMGKINQYDTSSKALDLTNYSANTRIMLKHNDTTRSMYIKFKTYTRQINLTDNSDVTVANNIYYLDINSISSSSCSLAFTWVQTFRWAHLVSVYKGVSYSDGWTVNDNQYNLLTMQPIRFKEDSTGQPTSGPLQEYITLNKTTFSKTNPMERLLITYETKEGDLVIMKLVSYDTSSYTLIGIYVAKDTNASGYYEVKKKTLIINYNSSNTLTTYNVTTDVLGVVFNPSNYYTKTEIDALIGNTEAILDDVIDGESSGEGE